MVKNPKTLKIAAIMLVIFTGATILNACTAKDRNTSFQQGQGDNFMKIADYDGKTFDILTLNEVTSDTNKTANISNKEIKISIDKQANRSLPLVNYETDAKLLTQVPLRGRPNFKYQALYRVTDNFLKVYQVGAKADIDQDQQTYAEVLPDGRLAVPLIGYPVKGFFNVEKVKNSDNEETNKLGEFSKERDQAKQFRFDINAGQIFEAATKENNLRADYFTGEWYFAATIVAAPENTKDSVGIELAVDQNLNSANRIKFTLTESLLKAQNMNIDERLDKKDDVNLTTALAIPIKWKEYEIAPKGRDQDLREREVINKSWNQKRFLEIDFDSTQSLASSSKMDSFLQGAKLTGLEVTDNYFSYTLQLGKENVRIRYSFLRVTERNYKAKRYFNEDSKIFGYFTTEKAMAINFEIQRREDLEKNILISRFNPTGKQVVFHFTKSSPDWIRPAARDVILAWDRAFFSAGTKLRIVLDESFDVDLGDLRYNSINLIESLSNGDLFGFGPSVTDSLTGEIISAASNIHITPIREALVQEIRNFVRSELGLLSPNYAQGISFMSQGLSGIQSTTNAETGVVTMLGDFLRRPMKIKSPLGKAKNIEFKNRVKNWGREKDLALTSGNIHQEIKDKCPEVIAYLATLKKDKITYNNQENEVFRTCSAKIMIPKVQGTLIHEMGHNFGLRHNFMGSFDQGNFWPTKVTETNRPVRSSSVMEYPAFNEDRLIMAGAYDIAALRFGYADSVLLNDNKTILALDPAKSISQNLGSQNIRPYKYCTDEDVMMGTSPFCDRWDAGTDPQQIVENLIQGYHTSTALLNYRYDSYKAHDPLAIGLYRMELYLLPMKRIYEEWRINLARFVGNDRKYLEGMDEVTYNNLLNKMSKDTRFGPIYSQYKPAVDRIYAFLKAMATLPNRYCVTQDLQGKMGLLELDSIRQNLFFSLNISVKSCTDEAVKNFLKTQNRSVVGQMGHFLDDLRYDLSPEKATEPLDVIGSSLDRSIAALMLSFRTTQSITSEQLNFAPGMLDEPPYRRDWIEALENRVVEGVDTTAIKKSLKAQIPDIDTALPERVERYQSEKSVMLGQWENLLKGLTVPDNLVETQTRKSRYSSTMTATPENYEDGTAADFSNGNSFVAIDKNAVFATRLAETYNQTKSVKDLATTSLEAFKAGLDFAKENIPTQQAGEKLTAGEFLGMMARMEKLKFSSPVAGTSWLEIMTDEEMVRDLITEKIKTAGGDKAKEEEIRASLVKTFFDGAKKPFEFSKEQVAQKLTYTLEASKTQYNANQVEINAKLDTMKKVMSLLTD